MLVQLLLAVSLAVFGARSEYPAAKDFTLVSPSGKKVALHEFRGKVVLLNFWATWCGPCREELPELSHLQRRLRKRGLQVVAVSVDNDVNNMRQFVKSLEIDLLTLWDPQKRVAEMYRVRRMPSTYLIDRRGKLRFVHHGYTPEGLKRIEAQIDELLHEGLPARKRKRR